MPKTDTPEKFETSTQAGIEIGRKQTSHKPGRRILWIVLLLIVGLGYWWFQHRPDGGASDAKPGATKGAGGRGAGGPLVVPVVAGTVIQKDVPIYLEGLGTVQAQNTVTIRVRVDGQLTDIAFSEGQEVHAGDMLAKIDPAPYKASLAQAEAKKRQDEALLANARADLARYSEMVARKAASQQQYDTQKSLVAQLEAAVGADDASSQGAKVQLDYTTIVSPIDGRIGLRLVDKGNIVHASDANGLLVITQLRPISVVFTLPEQNLREVRKQMEKGDLSVLATDRDDGPPLAQGIVTVIDNQIDTTTGTIKLKATFPNEDQALWPGQFVDVRLLLTTRKAGIVVPAATIQRGPSGSFAFVISKGSRARKDQSGSHDSHAKEGAAKSTPAKEGAAHAGSGADDLTVEVRPVKVAQIEDGEALIDDGLKPGERVVVEGQYRLQAHSLVKLAKASETEAGDEAP